MKPIFVFGSNMAGRHGKGAALHARKEHGAIYGQGEGMQGNSYAIPTKDEKLKTLDIMGIANSIHTFLRYAKDNPDKVFEITKIGTGLAGYPEELISPFFRFAPNNCLLPEDWEFSKRYKQIRLVIFGSRDISTTDKILDKLSYLTKDLINNIDEVTELCGMARGGDIIGKTWAEKQNIYVSKYPAPWNIVEAPNVKIRYSRGDPYNAKAGVWRNAMMAVSATHAIAIYKHKTPGTQNMLNLLASYDVPIKRITPSEAS